MAAKAPFEWMAVHQKVFEQTKGILSTDALLAYPNPDIPYNEETDASDYQLGRVIKQENCPVTYFSRKLNSAQKITQQLKNNHCLLLKHSRNSKVFC